MINKKLISIVRQPGLKIGTPVIAEKAIGFDGVLNYYQGRNEVV